LFVRVKSNHALSLFEAEMATDVELTDTTHASAFAMVHAVFAAVATVLNVICAAAVLSTARTTSVMWNLSDPNKAFSTSQETTGKGYFAAVRQSLKKYETQILTGAAA
jgi:acetylornithine/succinyldiaminopimelate/putrescine aminotransferase